MTKGAAEFPQKTFRNAYTLVIMFVSFCVLAFGGYLYTNHVQRTSDHQWCELLRSLAVPLDPNSKPTPTERQITINRQLITLYHRKCS